MRSLHSNNVVCGVLCDATDNVISIEHYLADNQNRKEHYLADRLVNSNRLLPSKEIKEPSSTEIKEPSSERLYDEILISVEII